MEMGYKSILFESVFWTECTLHSYTQFDIYRLFCSDLSFNFFYTCRRLVTIEKETHCHQGGVHLSSQGCVQSAEGDCVRSSLCAQQLPKRNQRYFYALLTIPMLEQLCGMWDIVQIIDVQ